MTSLVHWGATFQYRGLLYQGAFLWPLTCYLLAPHRPFCGEVCLRKQTQKPGRVPRAPGHLAVLVELLLSMCQAVLGASNISKDPCPRSRETSEATVNTVNYLLCLHVKSPWRGRRSRRGGEEAEGGRQGEGQTRGPGRLCLAE